MRLYVTAISYSELHVGDKVLAKYDGGIFKAVVVAFPPNPGTARWSSPEYYDSEMPVQNIEKSD